MQIRITLFVFLIMSSASFAQSAPEKEVATAVESLRKIMVDPDKAALEKITHAKLSYGHSSGKIDDQNAFIQALLTKESDFTSITLSDQTIKISGDVAIVRHKLSGKTHDKGKDPGTVNLGVMLVWTRVGGEWKLLGRQAYKI